ncbi:LPD38 domain-containing protein [Zoogloea dura]|uniref:MPN domain-containing protein n=1 Tax=Zoogloea dura TaxID=2728840 RepID=A0A848FWM6_9RHOO|nr:LPD38 domain-containing protein [Zoogloea dura]NML24337.1 hypothetical protein [Zoogloea dura]
MALKEYTGEIVPVQSSSPELKPYDGEMVPIGQDKAKPSPLRRLADVPVALAKGVVGAGEAAVGLADLATGGRAGKLLNETTGFDPGATKAFLDEQYSPQQKAAKAEVDQATGFMGKAKAMLENPSTIGEAVVESAPLMLGGGAVAQGLGKATKLGAVARSAIGEGVIGAGSAAEGIRQETPDGTLDAKQTAAAIGTGVGTAAITALSGGAARKLGISDLDTQLATRGGVAEGLANTSAKGRGRRLAEGAITEGVLEEMPQSGLEQGLQNVALDKPIGEGVPEAMAAGMLTGAAMGGPLAAAPATAKGTPPADPAAAQEAPTLALPAPPLSTGTPGAQVSQAEAEQADQVARAEANAAEIYRQRDAFDAARQANRAAAPLPFTTQPAEELAAQRKAAMGIDPTAGPLSAGAAIAVESLVAEEMRLGTASVMADGAERARQAQAERAAWEAANPGIPYEPVQPASQESRPAPAARKEPTGSFGAMNDFADLLGQERQDVAQRRAGIAERQGQRREFDLAEADRRTAESMQREAQARRRAVLDAVLADPETTNPAGRFAATLRREGYRDSTPTADELQTIQRFEDVRAAQPAPLEVEPSAPNELDPAAMGIRERRAPAEKAPVAPPKNLREGLERARAARAAAAAPAAQVAPPAAAPSLNPGEAWAHMDAGQRAALAGRLQGVPPIVSKNVHRADWAKINPALQGKLAEAMAPRAAAPIEGADLGDGWAAFRPESGTVGVPRAEMPQIKAEHRGAMVNFMNARGVQHQEETVPAASLKPTQAEFSREKVARAKAFDGGSRSILVSADNHVLDGHHQWMAARDKGEDVKVIRLDAPIRDLVGLAHDFPSSTTAGGAATAEGGQDGQSPEQQADAGMASQSRAQGSADVGRGAGDLVQRPDGTAGTGEGAAAARAARGGAPAEPAGVAGGGRDAVARAAASVDDLAAMAQDAGWAEIGGRLIRDQSGVASRTKWLPRAEWFRAGMEADPNKLARDIERFAAGAKVPAKSRRTIEGMLDWLDTQRGVFMLDEDASAYDFEAAGLDEFAGPDALTLGDIFAEVAPQDEAAAMRALGFTEEEIQDATGQEAGGRGESSAGQAVTRRAQEAGAVVEGSVPAQAGSNREGREPEGLTSYTNEDIARLEAEQKTRAEAEATAQREADQKAQADSERATFTLTGSDRPADKLAARGQTGLFDQAQEPGAGYTAEEKRRARRDDYTQDLFGNAVPDTPGGAGVGQQSASAENRNLLAAASVPGAVFATVTGARQTGELKTAFPVVDTASKAAHTFAGLRKRTTEHFAVLVLNTKGEPIAYSEMFSGGTSATSVYPDAVAKFVYGTPGASSFWVSHNHPSGSPTPSNADIQITKVLSKAYGQGTGIEMAGHVVIAGGKASLISRDGAIEEQGFAIPAMPRRHTIPVMRRDILRLDTFGDSITSPAAARVTVRVLSGKESGVVFLNAQNAPVAFLPMSQATMVRLRDGKSARALFGAAAKSNASAAMIHLGAQHSRAELEAASQNLHDALSGAGDIRILDAFLDEGERMFSLAESGDISGSRRGVFMSRTEQRGAAPNAVTAESLPTIFAERFPKLAGAIKTMLDRGALGQKGGLVVLESNDEAQIAREFADRTGRSFDDTVQLFAGAGEDINAFYDPESGLTFMVGPNLSAESLPAVVLHEMVHGQQRQELDQKALALIEGRTKEAPALRAFLDRVAERMEAVGEAGNPFEATSYIVEMAAQEGQQSGFSRADGPILAWIEHNIGRKVADMVRDFVATVRAWALAHGVELKAITVDDLVAYAKAGIGKAARGRVVTNEGGTSLSQRQRVSPENLPDAFVANPLGAAAGPDHDAAKAGDREAALRLARKLVTPEVLEHVRKVAPKDAVVVGVASIETTGRNALPETAATLIAQRLGLDLDPAILQANRPRRTTMDGLDRVFGQAEFDGPIEPGKSYVLVDDTLTQGGTFAALASHIEQNGGRVAAVVALTGKQYSSRLKPDSSLIQQLRNTHGDVESSFERATGYGFDGLTASEARYLANFKPADAVRARILAAVEAGDPGLGDGAAGPRFSRRGDTEGLTAPQLGRGTPRGPVRQARPAASITAAWEAPEPSKLFSGRIDKDSLIYTLQNKQIDMKRVVDAITAKIGQIADAWNPYLQEELFHGRSAKGVKDFLTKEMRPLLKRMRESGVGMEEFERFLHARHAKEANDHIAKINPDNPDLQDGGSGMTNGEARDIIAALSPERRQVMDTLAAQVDTINANTRKLLVESGLETAETVKAWEAAYKHYVPLQREDAESGGLGIGQGFSVRGSAAKRRTGSTRAVVDILANIAMQRERTIVRAEKNRVAQALYALSLKAPNPDFWMPINPDEAKAMKPAERQKIASELIALGLDPADAQNFVKEPVERYVNPATGLVAERINPTLRNRDNVLAVRVDGKDRFVFFNQRDERAQRMAGALKNLDADQLGRMLQVSAKVTRWFAAVNTQYNPIFGIVNALRDGQSALLQLSTTSIRGDEAKVLAGAVPAMKGIYAGLRRERAGEVAPGGEWSKLWEDFQENGGQTGFRDQFANSQDRADALRRELDPTAWADGPLAKIFKADGALRVPLGVAQQRAAGLFGWLSDYNDMMENGFRLSAYKAALDRGMSKQQAASIAKNLTVNFNRKGQVASQAGALYAFFNASMQGTARLWQTLNGPLGRKIIGGGLVLGVLQALILAAAGFGDDDPPEFVRERSIVIPLADGKYASIPMPLGYHVIPSFSRITTEWALGGFKDTAKRFGDILGLLADTFNPIGNAGISVQTIAPTAVDPLVALAENRDYTGKPIAQQDFNGLNPTPGHTRAKDTASGLSKAIAYWANLASGGTNYKPGLISPTPDQLDYLIGQITGGVGREYLKGEQTVSSLFSGEELPTHKIPLLGRFYGDTRGQSSEGARYYANLKEIHLHRAEIEGRRKDGGDVAGYLEENPAARLGMAGPLKVEGEVRKLRESKRDALEKGQAARVKMIDARITALMKQFNERVAGLEGGV